MSNTENIPQLTRSLALIACVAAALLTGVYRLTEKPIAAALQKKTTEALRDVLPSFDNLPGEETLQIDDITFYIAKKNGNPIGFAGKAITPKGYNGNITVLAGLQPNGTITTVLVTRQAETPGLGTVVCERKRKKNLAGLPPNPILDQFAGKKIAEGSSPWRLKKDGGTLDAVSGATITSRAVVDAVFAIAETFSKNRDSLLEEKP